MSAQKSRRTHDPDEPPPPNYSVRVDVFHHHVPVPCEIDWESKFYESEAEVAKLKAQTDRLRKSLDKIKAAQAKAAEDELAEDEQHATAVQTLRDQIAALEADLATRPPAETDAEKAERAEAEAELERLVAEMDELDGPDEEEPEPEPEPTPTPTPEPEPTPEEPVVTEPE
jgi:hypothetical protein